MFWSVVGKAQLTEPLTYSDLKAKVESGAIRNRVDLIRALPPPMVQEVKLIPNSKSTVSVSTDLIPRMLFSSSWKPSSSASLTPSLIVISISGEEASNEGTLVEIAETSHDFQKVVPYVIRFFEKDDTAPELIENPNDYFRGSRRSCSNCHQENFRWIWDGMYPIWKGTFGSYHVPGDFEPGLALRPEIERIKRFIGFAESHPIYSELKLAKTSYRGLSIANSNFNGQLSMVNAERIFHALRPQLSDPLLNKVFHYAFDQAATSSTRPTERQRDPQTENEALGILKEGLDQISFALTDDDWREIENDIKSSVKEIEDFKIYLKENIRGVHLNDELRNLAGLAFLQYLFRKFDIAFSDFYLPLSRGHLGFSDPNNSSLDLVRNKLEVPASLQSDPAACLSILSSGLGPERQTK